MKKTIKALVQLFPVGRRFWSMLSNLKTKCKVRHYAKMRRAWLQKYGREVMAEVHTALAPLGIRYFADYGTLLGLCRERGFIKHDDDIDFSVLPHGGDATQIVHTLLAHGFAFLRAFEFNGVITEVTLVYKGVNVDFFFMFEEDGGQVIYFYDRADGNWSAREWEAFRQIRPKIGSLVPSDVFGEIAPVPCNWEEVLSWDYGNWRVPQKSCYNNSMHITALFHSGVMLSEFELLNHR